MRQASLAVLVMGLGVLVGCPAPSEGPHAALPPEGGADAQADSMPLLPLEPQPASTATGAATAADDADGWALAQLDAPAPSDAHRRYTIRPGDCFWAIARRELNDPRRWCEIAALNPEAQPTRLRIGQEIKLPAE